MKIYVGVTDHDWFDYLGRISNIDEVNFWQPSSHASFRAIGKGDLFLFKLHRSPRTRNQDVIAGGGVFSSFSILPISMAWEFFEHKNGAPSYFEMRRRLLKYKKLAGDPHEDFRIGCILLTQPFFFNEPTWFAVPEWKSEIVRGKAKGYELDKHLGRYIWDNVQKGLVHNRLEDLLQDARRITEEHDRYGKEMVMRPRLGQGVFKVAVTDAYFRSCAITEEHSLPALEAAHIRPYAENGPHEVSNGLLLRSDFHRLFDRFYITVTPEYRIEISRRLKEEFENGRSYYPFHGKRLSHLPEREEDRPDKNMIIWHNEHFIG